jgi:glycosidase
MTSASSIRKEARLPGFGSNAELLDLIQSAHALGLQVYADLVFNHNSGGDAQELNPIDRQSRWTKFDPKSGKYPRDWKCFHPSQYEAWESATFDDMPDLCHRTPLVYTELINYARWLLEEIGFDGFRYDMVKGSNTVEQHAPCSGRWRGRDDLGDPGEKWTNESSWVDLWAPPRGYTVYVSE